MTAPFCPSVVETLTDSRNGLGETGSGLALNVACGMVTVISPLSSLERDTVKDGTGLPVITTTVTPSGRVSKTIAPPGAWLDAPCSAIAARHHGDDRSIPVR